MVFSALSDDARAEVLGVLARDFVVLDTETTGLTAPELVSIAILDRAGQAVLHRRVLPGKPIEPDASRVNGLTLESLAEEPLFPEIAAAVTSALSNRLVVIYNAEYDRQVLRNTFARYGLPMPRFDAWCAMEWFARVAGVWSASRQSFAWQSLAKAARFFGVDQPTAHDALADCRTTWKILHAAAHGALPE